MVTQKQFKEHFRNLLNGKAIYLWGANGETITKELVNKLYRWYGSNTYNRAYYDAKLKEGEGRIGADCSGAFFPLSKGDMTAKGYYNACAIKGSIKGLPKDVACMVFNKDFTHVGAYMGDGTTIEMRSSKLNVWEEDFNESRWAYYGIPAWLEAQPEKEDSKEVEIPGGNPVIKNIQRFCNEYVDAGLKIDGIYGPLTKAALVKALQHYLNVTYNAGLDEDGEFGPLTKAACRTISGKNELVYIAQAVLYCKGYDMSHSIVNDDLDGELGAGTERTVLEYQQDTRGLRHDGKCGPATFYSMFN
jgi:peptidoglycan hydrolase-like protein with peptidoglycan-binding domain